jgi:hypothetical protein
VSVKSYKSRRGAEGANNKLKEICGEDWKLANMPWNFTNDDGVIVELYRRENRLRI